jgi:DNA-directed RNA polymerase specialized sigma24 family protein
MPLDLELLQSGDNREICQAIQELELLRRAQDVVHGFIGDLYIGDVRIVALESIELLFTRAIATCGNIQEIWPLLGKIAERQAKNFLKKAFRRWERLLGEELREPDQRLAVPENEPLEVLRRILAERLHMEVFDRDAVVNALIAGAGLDAIEQCLLVEHIMDGCTQREFSERHGVPLKGLGGRKDRLLYKIRVFVAAGLPHALRAPFWRFLRRNR